MRRTIALTRAVSASIGDCALEHLERRPVDLARAREQHAAYEALLAELGCDVRRVAAADDLPDAVFVEDVAVVLDELAVLTRPGAPSRRDEVASVAAELAAWRPLERIEAPATLDGGDVLVLGRRVWVGCSRRTDAAGRRRLAEWLEPRGYRVEAVPVDACLHLKSAVTAVDPESVLLDPSRIDPSPFAGLRRIAVDPREPDGANALRVGGTVICAAACPRTRERLERAGIATRAVDASELAKAEGGLTCCSLIFEAGPPSD